MYIVGMRYGKRTSGKIKIADKNGIGIVKPLLLFFFGVLVPIITDEFLLIALCFAPFYGYMLWNERKFDESSIFVCRFVFAASLIAGFIISVLSYHDVVTVLDTVRKVLLVNVLPSFCFLVVVIVKVGAKRCSSFDYSPPSD